MSTFVRSPLSVILAVAIVAGGAAYLTNLQGQIQQLERNLETKNGEVEKLTKNNVQLGKDKSEKEQELDEKLTVDLLHIRFSNALRQQFPTPFGKVSLAF